MALTEVYVDPSIAADSGTGTLADPYGDLEYAVEQTTFDTTNGTRVNIKAGTDEVLAASLENALNNVVTTPAWAPTDLAPAVFQGYTAVAGDGGIGGISGGGSVSIMGGAVFDYIRFHDLHLHNTGAAAVIDLDNFCTISRCEVDNTTGAGILLDANAFVSENYVHNIGGIGIDTTSGHIAYNFLKNGTNSFTDAINGDTAVVEHNIISIGGASNGIAGDDLAWIHNNSIYSNGGTGAGINAIVNQIMLACENNLIEGFSGAGGVGIKFGTSAGATIFRGNAVYNCTTEYDTAAEPSVVADNESLTASPFTDAANDDFSPVDTGNVIEGSLPQTVGGGLV